MRPRDSLRFFVADSVRCPAGIAYGFIRNVLEAGPRRAALSE